MREKLARATVLLTGIWLVTLAVTFAYARNPHRAGEGSRSDETAAASVTQRPGADPVDSRQAAPPVDTLRARELFTELGCAGCHAVGDLGNPRGRLDGIGSRRTPASIRDWTVAAPSVADSLSPTLRQIKGGYAELPEEDLEVLIAWLASLGGGER